MDSLVTQLKEKVLKGHKTTKDEALQLCSAPLELLCKSADEIRQHFCGNAFDICTIINAKSGRCSEDCKYCAQSSFYHTEADEYPMLSEEEILKQAKHDAAQGIQRFSIVTSGRKLSEKDTEHLVRCIRKIREQTGLSVCGSLGLLNEHQFATLKEAGMERVHNNLESSRRNFPNVCTTHTYDDKIESLKAAQRVGMSLCCGGIMGLGETMEDRIDMALTIRDLKIRSIPLNLLNPIPGTPYENNPILTNDEMRRILAVYRFLLPNAFIRLAGGRRLLPDQGAACLRSGANAAISGDMLTTAGISTRTDLDMIQKLGFHVERCNG